MRFSLWQTKLSVITDGWMKVGVRQVPLYSWLYNFHNAPWIYLTLIQSLLFGLQDVLSTSRLQNAVKVENVLLRQ